MTDQDHRLDDVRELARRLRENEEHGPDDEKPVRIHGWATDATHGTEVTIEPDDGETDD